MKTTLYRNVFIAWGNSLRSINQAFYLKGHSQLWDRADLDTSFLTEFRNRLFNLSDVFRYWWAYFLSSRDKPLECDATLRTKERRHYALTPLKLLLKIFVNLAGLFKQ